METVELDLHHKPQTKLNDCWYASIQMLKTYRAGGTKTKPSGTHTMHLHKGLLGHRLNADSLKSKHFTHVLTENKLRCLPTSELDLGRPDSVAQCLGDYGPIAIGGSFGEVGPLKGFGHFIVLAGVKGDAASKYYKIYDPDQKRPEWRSTRGVAEKWWGDDESSFINDA